MPSMTHRPTATWFTASRTSGCTEGGAGCRADSLPGP